jgi:hypothetical protein
MHKLITRQESFTSLDPTAKMQLIKNNIERRGSGTVTLCPQEPEDMVRFCKDCDVDPITLAFIVSDISII